jgi:hypothetical protein
MFKIPEYKVCAASAVRAAQAPEWAKDIDTATLLAARKRRRELPIANAQPTPALR